MMKVHEVEQRSPEWEALRLGIPTASAADRILTPAKLRPSSQAGTYRNQLLAEWLLGHPIDWGGSSQFMERGTAMEPEARARYEFDHDVEARVVGFLGTDDGWFGGSPDSLVGDDGGLEIKCPAIHTHIGYMLDPAALMSEYRGQVQAYLYITRREWWDLMSYHPELPPVVERVYPDPEYLAAFDAVLKGFVADLEDCREKLAPHRLADAA